ncbi:MAG TPA: acyl-CoA reductase [Conexivisphaerales archaeon]|nr:acyl-CoA reductase [Conexivisphaerales archaeon]
MSSGTNPLVFGRHAEVVKKQLDGHEVSELSEASVWELLAEGRSVQLELSKRPVEERLEVIDRVGRLWKERLDSGKLDGSIDSLSRAAGYGRKLSLMEFSLVPFVLNGANIRRNLDASFPNLEGLVRFSRVAPGEYCRYMPVGPVFIISSGNSLIPPLIPTVLSLATGNFTLLRPSMANYSAVADVFSLVGELAGTSDTARLMSQAIALSYFTHDSPTLRALLSRGDLGLVNFWGGEPARTTVGKLILENPFHPRYLVNGPMTGFVVVDGASADGTVAQKLATNIVLYDQQLCSSPTQGAFIGRWEAAKAFAETLGEELAKVGSDYEMKMGEGAIFTLQSVRRILRFGGSEVYSSDDPRNMWTLVLSKKSSGLDDAVSSFPSFNLYNRKRFLEMVVVDTPAEALAQVEGLRFRKAFGGVDRVQTVGLAAKGPQKDELVEGLASSGVYRVTPVADMYMRSSAEPFDGVNLAAALTYTIHSRDVPVLPEGAS